MIFDDTEICSHEFADLLQKLMEYSTDQVTHYVVLDPDPRYYFYREYHKYSVVEIGHTDPSSVYISTLNEDPGGGRVDAIGVNWWALTIVPPSLKWFVHALRS